MKTQKMYHEEDYKLDKQHNEDERNGVQSDTSIWYN